MGLMKTIANGVRATASQRLAGMASPQSAHEKTMGMTRLIPILAEVIPTPTKRYAIRIETRLEK